MYATSWQRYIQQEEPVIVSGFIRIPILKLITFFSKKQEKNITERGGSVVTHETRIREVPGSNPGADQPDWGFFVVFLCHHGKCWVGFSLPRSI